MATLPNPRAAGQSAGNSRWFTRPILPCAAYPTGAAGVLVIRTGGVSDALYDVVAVSNWYDPAHPDAPLTVHGWQVLPRKAGHSYDVC